MFCCTQCFLTELDTMSSYFFLLPCPRTVQSLDMQELVQCYLTWMHSPNANMWQKCPAFNSEQVACLPTVRSYLTVWAASWTYRLRPGLISSYCHHFPCRQSQQKAATGVKRFVHIHVKSCETRLYLSVVTFTETSCIRDSEYWKKNGILPLLADWLDPFAKNLVMGNLRPLHIWFFMSFCSSWEGSQ